MDADMSIYPLCDGDDDRTNLYPLVMRLWMDMNFYFRD